MPPLVQLARAAPVLEAKRSTEYLNLPTAHLLNRCNSPRVPFQWTINPYRGCEFACQYCYARYTHEFLEIRDPSEFEHRIFAKEWDRRTFMVDLSRVKPGEGIALGTATDPYQPAERRFRQTRAILEVLAECRGLSLGITTKSNLVARDADLLARIAAANRVFVSLTVTAIDAALARKLEPLAPLPELRLAAARELSRAGIPVRIFCAPVMPLINDREPQLDRLAAAAAAAGARSFSGNVLFLQPCAQRVFFPFLEANFPHLAARYRDRFSRDAFLRGEYPRLIQERIRRIRARHGLTAVEERTPLPLAEQLTLGLG